MWIKRKLFSGDTEFLSEENYLDQKEFASVRGTKKLMNSTLKGIEQFQAKNPGATKEQIEKFIRNNPRLKKGVETLGEQTYKHVGGEEGAKKFIEAVGGKEGKFGKSIGERMENINKNIPKPEIPRIKKLDRIKPNRPKAIEGPRASRLN